MLRRIKEAVTQDTVSTAVDLAARLNECRGNTNKAGRELAKLERALAEARGTLERDEYRQKVGRRDQGNAPDIKGCTRQVRDIEGRQEKCQRELEAAKLQAANLTSQIEGLDLAHLERAVRQAEEEEQPVRERFEKVELLRLTKRATEDDCRAAEAEYTLARRRTAELRRALEIGQEVQRAQARREAIRAALPSLEPRVQAAVAALAAVQLAGADLKGLNGFSTDFYIPMAALQLAANARDVLVRTLERFQAEVA